MFNLYITSKPGGFSFLRKRGRREHKLIYESVNNRFQNRSQNLWKLRWFVKTLLSQCKKFDSKYHEA